LKRDILVPAGDIRVLAGDTFGLVSDTHVLVIAGPGPAICFSTSPRGLEWFPSMTEPG
jgi:hypothetical protein